MPAWEDSGNEKETRMGKCHKKIGSTPKKLEKTHPAATDTTSMKLVRDP